MKLTDAAVKAASCPAGKSQLELVDDGCRGLVLVVGKATKAWQCRFSLAGRRHRMPLGKYPALGLSAARAAASAAMLLVDQGRDPRADASTVSAAWAAYWKTKAATLRHPEQDASCWVTHIEPTIGALALADLSPVVFDRLQAAWTASGLGAGQSKPLRVLTGWQGWLLDRDLIGRPFIPRRVIKPAGRVLPVPPLEAVRGLLDWCEGQGPTGVQLALLALTGARRDMIQALRWTEVLPDALSWPADRMKGGRPFDQPLSGAARAWLDRVPPTNGAFVFPAGHGGSHTQVDLSRWTVRSPLVGFRTHDLRAAFATHGQEQLGLSPAVIAAVLDHSPTVSLGVTSRYLKAGPRLLWAERRAALEAWADLLAG